jgi:hypothetical protein
MIISIKPGPVLGLKLSLDAEIIFTAPLADQDSNQRAGNSCS